MYTCRRGIPEADGARGASIQELAGVWGIYFSVNDCRSVTCSDLHFDCLYGVKNHVCLLWTEIKCLTPEFFSLQWNWNRFLSCWFFFTPLFTIRIGRQLSKISATVLSLQNMSSAICKYRIVWSSGRHYFQHNLSHIKMMQMNVWEGRQCLIRKESACLNNQDLAIPIQDSET